MYPYLEAARRDLRRPDWPAWALVVALFAEPGDASLADTLRRELGPVSGPRWKAWHESVFGVWDRPCDCAAKLARWGRLYSYE